MGWTFSSTYHSKKAIIDDLLTHGMHPHTVVDHAVHGSELYIAVRFSTTFSQVSPARRDFPRPGFLYTPPVAELKREYTFIAVYLISKHNGKWGYKPMDEGWYPAYFHCPERLLRLSDMTSPEAVAWRAKCRELRALKASRRAMVKSLTPGDVLDMGEYGEVVYQGPYNKTGSQIIGYSKTRRGTFRFQADSIRQVITHASQPQRAAS